MGLAKLQILVLFIWLGSDKPLEGKLGETVSWMNSKTADETQC